MTHTDGLHLPTPIAGTALMVTAHAPLFGLPATLFCTEPGAAGHCAVTVDSTDPAVVRALVDAVFHPRGADGALEVTPPPAVSLDAEALADAKALAAQCSADADARAELLHAAARETEELATALGTTVPAMSPLPHRLRVLFVKAREVQEAAEKVRVERDGARQALRDVQSDLAKAVEAARVEKAGSAAQVIAWENTAAERDRSSNYYRGIVDRVAEALGPEAYTADDGTVMQDPARAKVAELACARLAAVAELRRDAARTDYFRGLLHRIGEAVGDAAYIGDDGERGPDILYAKLPDLVIPALVASDKVAAELDRGAAAMNAARQEVEELRATLSEVRAALCGAPGTPDQLLGAAVTKALAVATKTAVELTAAVHAPESPDAGTFHAGAVATRGAAADLAFRRSESTGDDIARAILCMDLPKPVAPVPPPVAAPVLPPTELAHVADAEVPADPPAEVPPAPVVEPAPWEDARPPSPAAADTPAVYDVVAASKGLSPWSTGAAPAGEKAPRTPPAPPAKPLDAPVTPPPAELTPAEVELLDKLVAAQFLKDCVLATRAAFPDWTADEVTAFFARVREKVTILRRIPAVTLPDRVATHLGILAGR